MTGLVRVWCKNAAPFSTPKKTLAVVATPGFMARKFHFEKFFNR
jgi:hypothetical protein